MAKSDELMKLEKVMSTVDNYDPEELKYVKVKTMLDIDCQLCEIKEMFREFLDRTR